jgi:hypothetical protein
MPNDKWNPEMWNRMMGETDSRDSGGSPPATLGISGSAVSRSPHTIMTDPMSTLEVQPPSYGRFAPSNSSSSARLSTLSRSGHRDRSGRPPGKLQEESGLRSISGRGDQSSRQAGDTLPETSSVGTRTVPTGYPTKSHMIEASWP